jgi:predicted phage terminase large subunit-like protein
MRRRRARNSLVEFASAIDVPGRPMSDDPDEWLFHPIETSVAPHHVLLMNAAERVITRRHGRGIFLLPPGSAKSTYCSVVLSPYVMGKWPGSRMIVASYGSDLARKQGRRSRQIVRSAGYRGIFNTEISSESSAADEWAMLNGSEYMAGGILSGITGNRANGIVIDDPVKGRDEADSSVIRKRTREAYEDDIKTRLVPGGWIIDIQTRWNEDDLAGGILPEGWNGESGLIRCRDGMDWEVLCIPAKADRADDPLGRKIGEYLWPEWFDRQHWAQFEKNARTWSALYQQKPAPETGSYWRADWLKPYITPPARETLTVYGGSDYAVTAGGGDYTVHAVIGLDPEDRPYLLDLWRGQESSDVWVERWCDMVLKWKPLGWAEELGQIKGGVGPFRDKRARERKAYTALQAFPTRGGKGVRAQSMRGRAAQLGLYVPTGADWYPDFKSELMAYPAGKNDDQHDAIGLVGQLLDFMVAGKKPKTKDQTVADGYREAQDEANESFLTM